MYAAGVPSGVGVSTGGTGVSGVTVSFAPPGVFVGASITVRTGVGVASLPGVPGVGVNVAQHPRWRVKQISHHVCCSTTSQSSPTHLQPWIAVHPLPMKRQPT